MQKTEHVQVIENQWITMRDGCKLAARIWLPESAGHKPVPAILEYIPYRKSDSTAQRDSQIHGFFARNGYACIRADLRGSGDSEGILRDEYLQDELDDGLEILRWIAAQKWSNGKVGMMGISWGGFNALQIAALQPPELKAIITVCSSDDRFADDVHYMGGCLLTDKLSWASTMFSYNSSPPDPDVVKDKWKDMWLDRLEGSGLWIKKWLKHQRRNHYWKHASVCEDYSAVQIPVYAVGGWADGYSNTIFKLLYNLESPVKGLVGPWEHKYPHMGELGHGMDFLGECLRWWDKWLKGKETGIMDEPRLQAWMQDSVSPLLRESPGRWIQEDTWPSPRIEHVEYNFDLYGLHRETKVDEAAKKPMKIQSPLSVGLFGGKWCSYNHSMDLPWDQRQEDGGALTFETTPLERRTDVLGKPEVVLEVSSSKPQAMVAVRLSDIAEDGRGTRVTFGLLNLTHRDSHEFPEELEPDKKYIVKVPMNYLAQSFPAGHRIRLSVSTSYWPLAWPSPEAARLTVHPENSKLILPVRDSSQAEHDILPFDCPPPLEGIETRELREKRKEWTVLHNLHNNLIKVNVINNEPIIYLEYNDTAMQRDVQEIYSHYSNNYDSVRGEVISTRSFERNKRKLSATTRTIMTSTASHFKILATLDAYDGEVRIFSKSWDESIPRDMI
ncbi:CocE/NonD family hydrolase [Desulfonatronovibrio magnus]|uniref:CocE/NonD family hydrolase n=1 Tax=Desulfonatronovibrio magnus TaxID=698827 RepID=UPI0005EAEC2E|nr:CocE/NonD family hydrolase [Desulfonatronovibrio magnus]